MTRREFFGLVGAAFVAKQLPTTKTAAPIVADATTELVFSPQAEYKWVPYGYSYTIPTVELTNFHANPMDVWIEPNAMYRVNWVDDSRA